MKKYTLFLVPFLALIWLENLTAQNVNLDVDGDVKILGKIDLSASSTDLSSLFIGKFAGQNNDATSKNNTGVGFNALRDITIGENNTAIGLSTLLQNEDGNDNVAIGHFALGNNQDGIDNTAIGSNALGFGAEGFGNTAVGKEALFFSTASYSTAIGYRALYSSTTGGGNLAVGSQALANNTQGAANTAIGDGTLLSNTTGNLNTALGTGAGVLGANLTNATAIGASARADESNSLILGSNANVGIGTSTPAPFKLKIVHGSGGGLGLENSSGNGWQLFSSSATNGNLILFANFSIKGNFNGTSGAYTATSDRRLKQNITVLEPVLEKVLQLEPSRYQFIENNLNNTETIGFIAQDVKKLFPEFVFESEDELSKGIYTMDYSGFGILAIKAIQEQQELIQALQQQNEALRQDLEQIKKDMKK